METKMAKTKSNVPPIVTEISGTLAAGGCVVWNRAGTFYVLTPETKFDKDGVPEARSIRQMTFDLLKQYKVIKKGEVNYLKGRKEFEGYTWVFAAPGEIDRRESEEMEAMYKRIEAGEIPVYRSHHAGYIWKDSEEVLPKRYVERLRKAERLKTQDVHGLGTILIITSPEEEQRLRDEEQRQKEENKEKRLKRWRALIFNSMETSSPPDPEVLTRQMNDALMQIYNESLSVMSIYDRNPED
jgi:hypothetical protein